MTSLIKVDSIQTAAGGTPTASSLGIGGVGKIGQVVQGSYSTSESTTSSSLVDSSLTASITPSATSSKILILLTVNCKVNRANAETYMGLGIKRDSTQVYTQSLTGFGGYIGGASEYQHFAIQHISYLDSPSTTSSITYTMNYAQTGGGTATVQYGNTNSFFQLMEVLA